MSVDRPQNMGASFTPGPWRVAGRYGPDGWRVLAAGHDVAKAMYLGGTDPAKANAHLIAAAPELYEALEELLDIVSRNGLTMSNRANTALAKARGA